MPTITVDSEVFAALQKKATPLVDTANDVLRRLLELEIRVRSDQRSTSARVMTNTATVGGFTPQGEYRKPILQILVEIGGRGRTGDILDRLPSKMLLTKGDHEDTSSGKIRYRHHGEWERLKMRQEGLISSASRHGIWEITEEGRNWLIQNP